MEKVDRDAMKSATMGCWWPSRAYPGGPCWSGIRDELALLARNSEERVAFTSVEETPCAGELARLADVASAQLAAQYQAYP